MKYTFLLAGVLWLGLCSAGVTPALAAEAPAASGPQMAAIPAGTFEMGDHHGFVDPKHGGDETPVHEVRIAAFQMAKTHVTNQQFGEFLTAALAKGLVEVRKGLVYGVKDGALYCDTSDSDAACSIGWDGKAFKVLGRNDHPMVCVRWEGAVAFCNWLSERSRLQPCYDLTNWKCDFTKSGFRLPTEAEWEYAARGGQTKPYRVYPYGDKADGTKANMPGSGDPYEAGPQPNTTPVGFYNGKLQRKADCNWPGKDETYQTADGANGFGLYDMAGNAWQWCNDWYDSRYYAGSPADNPKGPERGKPMPDGKTYRCIRGGSWYNGPDGHSRVANRNPAYYRGPKDPDHNWYAIGFRVAQNAESASVAAAPTTGTPTEAAPTIGLMLNSPKAFQGYTLFAPKHFLLTYLMDNSGRVVNTWKSNYEPGQSAYLLPNGHLLRACFTKARGFTGGGEGGRIEEYDWDGKMVWEFDYATDTYMQHHDIKPLPNGNILMLVVEKKTREQCLAAGFDERMLQDRELYPDSVVEIQPTYPKGGKVVWEWHVWDHLLQDSDRAKPNFGKPSDHPERIWVNCNGRGTKAFWNHMNSLDYNAKLDQILLSVRGCSEIWIIDHATTTNEAAGSTGGKYGKGGDLLYRWGNPAAYGRGTVKDQMLFQQHDPTWIPEGYPGAGNILVFNNGLNRLPPGVSSRRDMPANPVGKDWGYSSIDELVPPITKEGGYELAQGAAFGPQKLHWTYTAKTPTDFFAEAISGAQRLPNGNTLVCDGTSGVFFEVTSAGETVWKYVSPVVRTGPLKQGETPGLDHRAHKWNAVFKVTRYAPDYVGLKGQYLTPKAAIPGTGPQMPERSPSAEPPRDGPRPRNDDGQRPPRGGGQGDQRPPREGGRPERGPNP